MIEPRLMSALNELGLMPKTYDSKGWAELIISISKLTRTKNLTKDWLDGDLPETREAVARILDEYQAEVNRQTAESVSIQRRTEEATALAANNGMLILDANKFSGLSDDARLESLAKFMERILKTIFPRCYPELNPSLIDFLSSNFMYTPAGGKYIYYTKISDSPNIWEESPVSPPFENSYGQFRETITALLALNCSNEFLQVIATDKSGTPKLFRKVPKWQMFKKYRAEIMKYITGSAECCAVVQGYINKFIEDSKRRAEGRLTETEIKRGVESKTEMLHDLDLQIPDMPWCHRPEVHIANMTNDLTTPAFAYFDLNSLSEGPTPDFDGFLTGIYPECRDTFMAAVYATFYASSQLSQYIWLHGEGGDGKSSFLAAIAEFAGKRLACSLNATAIKSDFGLEECVNKRVVIISDVKTGLTVKSGIIHNLTGHDPIWVNRKNKPGMTVTFNPVLWIASNDAPDVDFSNPNESRRCIYIRVKKPDKDVQKKMYFLDENGEIKLGKNGRPQFNGYDLKSKLVAEMPHILYKCKEAFDRVCPAPHNAILQSDEALDLAMTNCIDLGADETEYYLQKTFDFTGDQKDRMKQADLFHAIQEQREADGIRSQYNQFDKRSIRRKLENAHGCVQKKIHGLYYMTGIKRKDASVSNLGGHYSDLKPYDIGTSNPTAFEGEI